MSTSVQSSPTKRRYDFDWLRAGGAVMVVVAHCTMLFSPWMAAQSSLFLGRIPTSKFLGELVWNLNLWLMPLFMLLAGASVWYTLRKRTNRQYLRERLVHLGFPFALLMIVYVVPMTYVARTMMGEFTGSLPEFYLHFFEGIYPSGNFNLFHLWFLFYLLIYALLTLPLFRFLQSERGQRLIELLAGACQRPGGLYLFALPLVLVQLAFSGVFPLTIAAAVVVNDWTHFIGLLLVFVFGYILLSDARFQVAIERQWRLAAVVALVLSAMMFVVAWPDTFDPFRDLPLDYSWQYVVFWTIYALCSWSWLLAWLGLGQRFLNFDHPLLKLGCEASFPLYLLHLLVWGPSALLIGQLQLAAFPSAVVLTTLVLGGTLALAAVLKRWRFAGMLLGLKYEPTHPSPASSPKTAEAMGPYLTPIYER